jgi:hypothetical protein
MPKIRDLGINAIPGAYQMCGPLTECLPLTQTRCDPPTHDEECDRKTKDCERQSRPDCKGTGQCDPNPTHDHPCSHKDRQAHPGLPHDAVIQLRQQLQSYINPTL